MRIAVAGASGVLGRGLVARLLSQGHDVAGIARRRPESWPSSGDFVAADIRDADAVRRAVTGADVVVHCAWARRDDGQVNIPGTANLLAAMTETGSKRIVFASSAHVYGALTGLATEHDPLNPVTLDGRQRARVEDMLARSGLQWVAIRCPLIVGRDVNNGLRGLMALPLLPAESADRPVQVIHTDDAVRLLARAILESEIASGPVNLAAPGTPTFRQIAAALGRPVVPIGPRVAALGHRVAALAELQLAQSAPLMDTTSLREDWKFAPAWTAQECVEDFALAVRGRVSVGRRVLSLPWRLANIQDLPRG